MSDTSTKADPRDVEALAKASSKAFCDIFLLEPYIEWDVKRDDVRSRWRDFAAVATRQLGSIGEPSIRDACASPKATELARLKEGRDKGLPAAGGLPPIGSPVEVPDSDGTWIQTNVTGHCTTPTFTVADDQFEDDLLLADDEGITWRRIPQPHGTHPDRCECQDTPENYGEG